MPSPYSKEGPERGSPGMVRSARHSTLHSSISRRLKESAIGHASNESDTARGLVDALLARMDIARKMGADHVFDFIKLDPVDEIRRRAGSLDQSSRPP
jgi:predicted butyrate kinase (DUF1464 family)